MASRQLQQQNSHPDAPHRRVGKNGTSADIRVPGSDDDLNEDEDVKTMMRTMMGMMKGVTKDLGDVKERVTESMATAERAVNTANQVASTVSYLQTAVKKTSRTSTTE